MCKHVAAVLYGVGARLDESPEMLFVLRGVNHEELVDVTAAITDAAKSGTSRRRIAASGIADVFGIDLAGSAVNLSTESPAPSGNSAVSRSERRDFLSWPGNFTDGRDCLDQRSGGCSSGTLSTAIKTLSLANRFVGSASREGMGKTHQLLYKVPVVVVGNSIPKARTTASHPPEKAGALHATASLIEWKPLQ